MRPIYKENLVLIKRMITSGKFEKDINDFRKLKPTRKKLLKSKSLQTKLKKLVNKILQQTGLPAPLFRFSVTWYVLYGKFDAPGMNFILTMKGNSVALEFFRKPHANDWKIANDMVASVFEKFSKVQRVRIDPRLTNTIDRKLLIESHLGHSVYNLIDEIWGEEPLEILASKHSKDIQKRRLLRQDRSRLKRLNKKLGLL